jgi:hypothetical protein
VGESGCVGAPPAVVNAVLDALSPLGITNLDMPITAARVWEALQQACAQPGPESQHAIEPVLEGLGLDEDPAKERTTG